MGLEVWIPGRQVTETDCRVNQAERRKLAAGGRWSGETARIGRRRAEGVLVSFRKHEYHYLRPRLTAVVTAKGEEGQGREAVLFGQRSWRRVTNNDHQLGVKLVAWLQFCTKSIFDLRAIQP